MASRSSLAPSVPAATYTQGWLLWWPVIVMMLGTLLSYVDRGVLAVLSPMILADTKMNAQTYGEVISAFSLAYTISTILWGSVIDRVGLRVGMAIALAIWMVSSASHSMVSTFLGFAIARAVLGLGEGAMFPGGFRTAMDTLPPEKQARGLAIAYSGSSAGSILAPLMIMPIAVAYGWRSAFLVTPALALIWLFLWIGTVKPPALVRPERSKRFALPNVLEVRFWSLVASYALGALPVGAVTYLAPLYLSRAFGIKGAALGHVLWIPPAGLEAGFFFWGWIADRFAHSNHRPAWLFGVMSLVALPGAAITSFHSPAAVIALLTVTLFASAGFIVVALRTGAMAYKREQRSMAAGIASSSFSAAVALVMPFCGRLFDAHLYSRAFLIVGMAPLVGTVIWYLLPVRPVEDEQVLAEATAGSGA